MPALLPLLVRLRRRVLIHRRGLAALCAGLAVLLMVQAVRPPAPATISVWVAARDVPAGAVLDRDDVRRVAWPEDLDLRATAGLDHLLGRTVALPLQRGQPLTKRSVLGSEALAGYPGRDAIAIRIPDPDVAGLLAPGDEIDLWVTDGDAGGESREVAASARVVAVPEPNGGPLGSATGNGRVVILAVERDLVGAVAAAATGGFLSVVWNR